MKQVRKRLTYANVMSSLAVFLVLGGGAAVAANQLGKNTVGKKQLKANAVTTAKIKKNAVTEAKIAKNAITSAKIRDGAVSGVKVNVSTLGTVPNATNAQNFSRYFTSGIVRAAPGQTVQILSVGPFTVTGHCEDDGGGDVKAYALLTTSQAGSSMSAYNDAHYEADFSPGIEAEIGSYVSDNGPHSNDEYYPYYYNGFTASSADAQTMLSGMVTSAVFYYGAPCAFWAHGTNDA